MFRIAEGMAMRTVMMRESEPHGGLHDGRSWLWIGLLALVPLICAPRSVGGQPTRPVRSWPEVGALPVPPLYLAPSAR